MEKDVNTVMKLDMEDGGTVECTGADVYNLVFNSGQLGALVVMAPS